MNKCVIALSVLYFITISFAQAPDTLWTKTYGGIDDDIAYSVQQTTDGGYIIAGLTSSVNPPDLEACLIKTNENGDSVWIRTYGIGRAKSVVQTTDGGYIWTGSMNTSLRIVKTDSLGDTLWSRIYKGGNYFDIGEEVQQTADGRYVVVGMTSRFTGVEYEYSVFLLRIDYDGDTLWTNTFGWNFAAWGYSVKQTYDAGFIIAGYQMGDVCLIKTDANGNPQWIKSYGGGGPQEGYSVLQTADSGYICTGREGSTDDVYLIRTNSFGDTLWTQTYGGAGYDGGHCIRETQDSNYIITGYLSSFGNGSHDVYILKIYDTGDSLWALVYGGDSIDIATEIEVTSDGGYMVVGATRSFGAGGYDVWLLKIAPDTLGITEEESVSEQQTCKGATIIYGPLQLPEGKICRVFDITGRVIAPDKIKPGIYFIEVDGKITKKIIKVK